MEEKTERLLRASEWGDVEAIRAILESGDVDVNGADRVRLLYAAAVVVSLRNACVSSPF
jgi:hypothetical protein